MSEEGGRERGRAGERGKEKRREERGRERTAIASCTDLPFVWQIVQPTHLEYSLRDLVLSLNGRQGSHFLSLFLSLSHSLSLSHPLSLSLSLFEQGAFQYNHHRVGSVGTSPKRREYSIGSSLPLSHHLLHVVIFHFHRDTFSLSLLSLFLPQRVGLAVLEQVQFVQLLSVNIEVLLLVSHVRGFPFSLQHRPRLFVIDFHFVLGYQHGCEDELLSLYIC